MLAGRKLLLADDSITIQKVVDLTFADEGVNVLCVSNGREAIERLDDFRPDVVLADVFMPQMNGYEVCEYIKQSDRLRHIPVMLLVGSFEPFDEKEARRVGANDTLTKPFQSIKRLIDKVGILVRNRPPEESIPTAELPQHEEPPVEKLSTAELEITTADTLPLPPELKHVVEHAEASRKEKEAAETARVEEAQSYERTWESKAMKTAVEVAEEYEGAGEVLLDLGDFQPGRSALDDDFVLDLDLDEVAEPSAAEPAFHAPVPGAHFGALEMSESASQWSSPAVETEIPPPTVETEIQQPAEDQFATAQGLERIVDEPVEQFAPPARFPEVEHVTPLLEPGDVAQPAAEQFSAGPSTTTDISAQQLSPEMIDAIARRAVEQLSEKVIQEIAWEVVPQLAELLIKRQLEEKNS